MQLMADIVTLNLSAFLLMPVAGRLTGVAPDALDNPFLEARKAEIIALVRYRLYGKL